MLKALNQGAADGPKETIDHLYEDICAFTDGNEQFDDITMLAFRYRGDRNEAEMI
jgi:serine phosphatase RsbU (regulator of sigma subunit)